MLSCCYRTDFKEKFLEALSQSTYTANECRIIKSRYVSIVVSTESKSFRTDILFYLLTNVITIAGVLISSLISLEKATFIEDSSVIFWLIWSFSLALILANKWLYTFNIHKKHVLNATVMEKLYAEGWCFIASVGKYNLPTEHERFKRFISRVEKLKMKYIESLAGMEGDGSVDVSDFFSPRKSIESEETKLQRLRLPRDDTDDVIPAVPKKRFKLAKTMSSIIKPHKPNKSKQSTDNVTESGSKGLSTPTLPELKPGIATLPSVQADTSPNTPTQITSARNQTRGTADSINHTPDITINIEDLSNVTGGVNSNITNIIDASMDDIIINFTKNKDRATFAELTASDKTAVTTQDISGGNTPEDSSLEDVSDDA